MKGYILFLSIFLMINCSKERQDIITDENGIIITQPFLWRVKISENGYNGGYVSDPIFDDEGVLLGAQDKEGFDYLLKLDTQEGIILWKSEYLKKTDLFSLYNTYRNKNQIVIKDGYNLGLINLDNGNYIWKKRINDDSWSAEWLSGIDSIFFIIKAEPYPGHLFSVESAYLCNLQDGDYKLFLVPDLGDLPEPDYNKINISIGGFRYIKPFKEESSNNIMLLCYCEKQYYLAGGDKQVSMSYVGLYNFTQKTWAYELVELGEYNFLGGFTPTIIGDRFYHTLSSGICECRDLDTGAIIWRKEGPYQFSDNGFTITDGKMIVIDDLTRNLMALNIENGQELWRTKTAANPSMLYELNGVVYFIGGSDGKLYAVDINAGNILWSMESPDHKRDTYNYFKKECKVIPGKNGEKGKIIVSSFTHAYCYEAAG